MPRKAREILKARGYTDAELDSLTLLSDTRFASALEAEDAERERLAAENTKINADLAATTKWYYDEAVPALNTALNDATTARAERARLEAQIKAEQDYGMRRVAAQDNQSQSNTGTGTGAGAGAGRGAGSPESAGTPDFSTYDQRYVNADTFRQAFAQTGDAIAMATDIMEDHRDLFGKRLPDGLGGLRAKYQRATETGFKGTLRDYWEKEYNVAARRTELQQKQQEDHDRKIADEAVRKYQSEHLNPMTRVPESSRSPFVRKAVQGGTRDGKQPWERGSAEQRASERVVKFGTKVLTGTQDNRAS